MYTHNEYFVSCLKIIIELQISFKLYVINILRKHVMPNLTLNLYMFKCYI